MLPLPTVSIRNSRSTAVALVTFAAFADLVAYAVAIPVLPDLSRRLGASPTVIGLLFGSFGVTLLTVSIPSGALSDRIGRRAPLVGGLILLAVATLFFAFATTLPWLFAARLAQGAADAITWAVGFALIADLYGPNERGRMTGIVMSGTSLAIIIGPSIGGWLYEIGGIRLPFLMVAAMAALGAIGFIWIDLPDTQAEREIVPLRTVIRTPEIAACTIIVIAASSTISMVEPVLALHLSTFGIGPGRVGTLFAIGAVFSTFLHPAFGRLADRWGARRVTLSGLFALACAIVLLGHTWSFGSAVVCFIIGASSGALVITPSLSYMGEATSNAGIQSFGVAYGIYNMAWGAGLLAGPAIGGFLYERMGFGPLSFAWAPALITIAVLVGRVKSIRVTGPLQQLN